MEEYLAMLADDVTYIIGDRGALVGKKQVLDWYEGFLTPLESVAFSGEHDFRVIGRTGIIAGTTQITGHHSDGTVTTWSGNNLIIFSKVGDEWLKTAEQFCATGD
jgi:ketosteroid isomerase-like protein